MEMEEPGMVLIISMEASAGACVHASAGLLHVQDKNTSMLIYVSREQPFYLKQTSSRSCSNFKVRNLFVHSHRNDVFSCSVMCSLVCGCVCVCYSVFTANVAHINISKDVKCSRYILHWLHLLTGLYRFNLSSGNCSGPHTLRGPEGFLELLYNGSNVG